MVKIGILQSEARQLVKKYSHQQIVSAVAYTKKRLTDKKSSKIENPAAYLRKALSNGWAIVESSAPKPGNPTANPDKKPDLLEMYQVKMIREAEEYFSELNSADQTELISEYNATDVSPTLKVKRSKPGKAVRTEFFKWLAKHTWGDPKPEDLLQYAQKLIDTTSNVIKN